MKVTEFSSVEKILVTCPSCSYQWVPRFERPKVCPRCKCWLEWTALDGQGEDAISPKS